MSSPPPPVSDPDFDINIAMNTFSKQLGERVRSGQMTVADAQRAQAQMRALQVNPAMANRAAATEIAQRALQVGPYHPSNIAAQQAAAQPVTNPVSDYIANMNAPAAEQKPDIVQMLGKYNLGAAPGALGGTLGGIGLQSVDAPAPTTPPPPVPRYMDPINSDDFIPRNVRSPMTVMDTLNLARTLGTAPQQLASIVGMPMAGYDPAGYDPAAQYRGFGNDLMALINSGAITPQQANAIKAPVFEAVRLGNTNQGYNQMQAALAAGRQQMGQYTAPVQPMPQPVQPVQTQPMPQGQPTPGQPTPVQGMYRGGFAVR